MTGRPIVIVDDEPILVRILARTLARTGAPVRTFTDPEEALAFLRANDVAVVLCDHRMPKMTGIELRAALDRDVAFYIVSGDLALDPDLSAVGLSGIVGKPVRPETLLEIVRAHLDEVA